MTGEEQREADEVLQALEARDFMPQAFGDWLRQRAHFEDIREGGWWMYKTAHGRVGYVMAPVSQGVRITDCAYVGGSSGEQVWLVVRGRSASGKTLPQKDLERIDYEYSFEAIPERVLWACAMKAGHAPEDLRPQTRIVEDLLDGEDDEFERSFLLGQVFDELSLWFTFEEPDVLGGEELDRFQTVQDIITYVQQHYRES